MGKITWSEKVILVVFGIVVLLWMFSNDLIISGSSCNPWHGCVPGWTNLFPHPAYIQESVVPILGVVVLFLIPARDDKNSAILDWQTCNRLHWGLLWLLGGGFALAKGLEVTGLAEWIGAELKGLSVVPPEILVVIVVAINVFLTELMANSPAAQIFLPIAAGLSVEVRINPFYLTVPATIAISCAFMLPSATGPNAVVFCYGVLTVWDMIKCGLVLNFISILAISFGWFAWGQFIFNANPREFPDWAIVNSTVAY